MEILRQIFGLELQPKDMTVLQICARAVFVFISSLVIVRLANRRFLSKLSPLDFILGFVLASVLGRAINGSGPLFQSVVAGLLLVLLHRALGALSFRFDVFGKLVKGEPETLIVDGALRQKALASHNISDKDLKEILRLKGKTEDVTEVAKATLERDGEVSIIKRKSGVRPSRPQQSPNTPPERTG